VCQGPVAHPVSMLAGKREAAALKGGTKVALVDPAPQPEVQDHGVPGAIADKVKAAPIKDPDHLVDALWRKRDAQHRAGFVHPFGPFSRGGPPALRRGGPPA